MKRSMLVCALALAGCAKGEAAKTEPSPAPSTASSGGAHDGQVEVVPVLAKPLDTSAHLEGELAPYASVALHSRANGFVRSVTVDRGSKVQAGQALISIAAPELTAQRAEAEAKLQGDRSTYERLRAAAQTPGAVAGHEVDVAEAGMKADESKVQSLRSLEQYLTVTAPFAGVITERNVHPGALVGPQASDKGVPMLRLEQVETLRLTVPVPEQWVGQITEGAAASFTVRAWPGQKFSGTTKRVSRTIDTKTRAMAVELDVDNAAGKLSPGMFADVQWPVKKASTFFVPTSAIVTSTEKTFVVRVKDGVVDHVPVQRGVTTGELVEIFGAVEAGDLIAKRGTEELRVGSKVPFRVAGASEVKAP